MGRACSTHASD